ncbi:MAG: cation:proton antiporter [Vulcanimicrobiota bacterium]
MDHLLIQIAVLVFFGRVLGEMSRRAGQPAVIGELLAGILLGPTALGKLWPAAQSWIFPAAENQGQLLATVARLGVLLLLLVTGFEIDLSYILGRGRRVLQVALWGTMFPLLFGTMLGMVLPETLMGDADRRPLFAMFLAVAMSISAMAVLAKILLDLDVMKRDLGQTMVAVAMSEDLLGWVLLSLVVGLAGGDFQPLLAVRAVAGAVVFLTLAFTLGRWFVDGMLTYLDDRDGGVPMQMSAAVFLAMLLGTLTHELGLEPMLGAFVAGILCGQARRFHDETEHALKLMVTAVFSPIFFANAGLKVDLLKVINPTALVWGVVIVAVASLGKLFGASFGAWMGGFKPWERLAFGVGLNARGSMEIIVATVGYSLKILSVEAYSIIVMMAMSLCLLTPGLLRVVFREIPIDAEEQARLDQAGSDSFLKRLKRVLVPLRGGPNAEAVAQLVARLGKVVPFDITLMHVDNQRNRQAAPAFEEISQTLQVDLERAPTLRHLRSQHVIPLIERESRRGYQLMVLGASQATSVRGSLFNHAIDRLLRDSGCAVAVVHVPRQRSLAEVKKVMVPTTGTQANETAIEMAACLAQAYGAELKVVHVLETPELYRDPRNIQHLVRVANSILEQQTETALRYYPQASGQLLQGDTSEGEILNYVAREQFDLIVLRGSLRHNSGRAFLGHRAERLLKQSPCPVMVLCNS